MLTGLASPRSRPPICRRMTGSDELLARLQRALGGRYRIERELSRGGMGQLFLATEPSLGREVVVKLLPPELASDLSVARFQRSSSSPCDSSIRTSFRCSPAARRMGCCTT